MTAPRATAPALPLRAAMLGVAFFSGVCGCVHASSLSTPGGKAVTGSALQLDGRPLSLETLRGQVVLLDFFATWCEPCKRGLPVTQALVAKNAPRGLAGWAVSLDDQMGPVAPFVTGLNLALPVLYDDQGRLADELGVEKLPTAVVLDRRGAVRFVRYGAADEDEAEVERVVDQLLRER
jgi:cytochrome c biogenesis protein CcmG, thiol:disulfide interchange protein DsbE